MMGKNYVEIYSCLGLAFLIEPSFFVLLSDKMNNAGVEEEVLLPGVKRIILVLSGDKRGALKKRLRKRKLSVYS
jgi:hypothetical protein